MKKIAAYFLLALGMLLSLGAGSSWWYYKDALHFPDVSFADTRALIEPYFQVYLPPGEGPFPTALMFHGCGGLSEFSEPKAKAMTARGFAAIIIDSHTPRNIDWTMSCDGRVMLGAQRATDVLVALDFARSLPQMDADALFLVGYSHGSWTVLEALHYNDALPPGLADSPGQHLDGVRGVVAWYPYCGFVADFTAGWMPDVPVLMLLAADDEITDPQPCEAIASQQASAGKPVDFVTYPGVSHGFDITADWVISYDAETAAKATAKQFSFLDSLLDRG